MENKAWETEFECGHTVLDRKPKGPDAECPFCAAPKQFKISRALVYRDATEAGETKRQEYERESYHDLSEAIQEHLSRFVFDDDIAEVAILLNAIEGAGAALSQGERSLAVACAKAIESGEPVLALIPPVIAQRLVDAFDASQGEREPVAETLYTMRCGWCGAYEGTVDPTEPCAKDSNTGEYIGPHQFGITEPYPGPLYASPPVTGWLDMIEREGWTLRGRDVPTGGDDYDVVWEVVEHYMAEPHDRVIGTGSTPLEALQDAASPHTETGEGDTP